MKELSSYKLKFSVADAAAILNVEKKLIKDWAYFFSDYMGQHANPAKGLAREFRVEDIRVMAYVLMFWEEEPDITYIKQGLNSNSHYENEAINNLIIGITPFFIEPPEDIDENWKHGVVFSGLAKFADTFYLANSFKLAGDRIVESALKEKEAWELFCPAVYNYRHAIELYMKAITGHYEDRHNLIRLYRKLEKLLKKDFNETPPKWFYSVIVAFADFDPGGTTFRYGGDVGDNEVFVDFRQLKRLMGWMAQSFQNIRMHQGMSDAKL